MKRLSEKRRYDEENTAGTSSKRSLISSNIAIDLTAEEEEVNEENNSAGTFTQPMGHLNNDWPKSPRTPPSDNSVRLLALLKSPR